MKKIFIISNLIFWLTAFNAFSECTTDVSGYITDTWAKTGSPYCVVGNVDVLGLVIEPGVRVEFKGNYEFKISGAIVAVGSDKEPIVFSKSDDNVIGWQGIFFDNIGSGSELSHCIIEGSINSGVRIDNCEPTIRKCTIRNNTSPGHGGGMYAVLSPAQTLNIHDNIFENNTANPSNANIGNYVGGALYFKEGNAIIQNNKFIDNTCNSKCQAIECGVTSRGGAIYIGGTGDVMIKNNLISNNEVVALNENGVCFIAFTHSYGGGVYANSGNVTLENNILVGNSTTVTAGGPNCGLQGRGSGLYVNGGSVAVVNCTIAYNNKSTGVHRASGTLGILNTIIYFNNNNSTQVGGTPTITYSDIQGGYPGDGNISVNPTFGPCYQIKPLPAPLPQNACVDAGDPDPMYNDVCFPPSLDIDRDPYNSERNDMGAHGGPGGCGWIYWNGDFDMDYDIDGSDLAVFAADFGRTNCSGDCEGDFDTDNDVDGSDLAVFVANFGITEACPWPPYRKSTE